MKNIHKIKIDRNWLEMNYDEVKHSVISGEILDILKNMKSSEEKPDETS